MTKYDKSIKRISNFDNGKQTVLMAMPEDMKNVYELLENYYRLKNEFCLQCGKYKTEHLGSCKDCKWHQ